MPLHLLYPSDPLNPRAVDEAFADEHAAVVAAGWSVSLLDADAFERGVMKARPPLAPGTMVVYRGWMLSVPAYEALARQVEAGGASVLTRPDQYARCHHLPGWYGALADHGITAETVVLARNADFARALGGLDWPGYFVKDYVKSLSTGGGSLVDTPAEVARVVDRLEHYRGVVEGGVCVRRREDFVPGSERRCFVVRGQGFAAEGPVPEVVATCARRIDSPFFTVDTARTPDGRWRVVELGDGQVSDRKEWGVEAFVAVLGRLATGVE